MNSISMWNKIMKCDCAATCQAWAPLALRVVLGTIFVWHGYDKVFSTGIEGVSGFLGSLGFPLPMLFAYILAYGELIAGALLIAGLFTHWASKFALVVAIVAFFTVHMSNGFSIAGGGYEYIVLIAAAAFSVLITGPGAYSVDEMWRKETV